MDAILEFFVNNYMWFLIISLILIFALIGYIVDTAEKKSPKLHFNTDEDIINTECSTLKEIIEENVSDLAVDDMSETLIESSDVRPESNNENGLPKG